MIWCCAVLCCALQHNLVGNAGFVESGTYARYEAHKVHIEHLHPIMTATHLHGGLSRNIDDLTKSKQVAFNC